MTPIFTEQRVIRYPGPFSLGPSKIIGAIANNGKQYTAQCSSRGADTFFSIPARIKVKGKTVSGYVTTEEHFCWNCGGDLQAHDWRTVSTYNDDTGELESSRNVWYCVDGKESDFRMTWLFRAYQYGKNAKLVMPTGWLSDRDLLAIVEGGKLPGRSFHVRFKDDGRVAEVLELLGSEDQEQDMVFVACLDMEMDESGYRRKTSGNPPKVIRRGKGY